MKGRRTRLEPFFERSLDKRIQEVEAKRFEKAAGLGARMLSDGRFLAQGSKGVYYLRPMENGAPVCFCLDSHRGQDRCKHVMAALRETGDSSFGHKWSWDHKEPWGTRVPNFVKVLAAMKLGVEEASDESTALTSWVLSWPKLTLENLKEALEARTGFMMSLGALRFSEAAGDPKIRKLIWDKIMPVAKEGYKWPEIVVGRMLPWMEPKEAGQAWGWLREQITDWEAATILEAAGADTARKIPREALVGLMQSVDSTIREKTIKALRTTELPVTISLSEVRQVVKRRTKSSPSKKTGEKTPSKKKARCKLIR